MHSPTVRYRSGAEHLARARAASRASRRKRGVNPATVDREYSGEEVEWLKAVEAYQHRTGMKFLTFCQYLEILKSLGYVKVLRFGGTRG